MRALPMEVASNQRTVLESLSIGARFGPALRYEMGKQLGRGGVGIVRLAYDHVLRRPVAVKSLQAAANYTQRNALLAEASAMAQLNHEGIVHLYDFGSHEGDPYIVMEYVEGETLQETLARGQPTASWSTRLLIDVCCALESAHADGVYHLDLKPSNLLVSCDGLPKLLDFGTGSLTWAAGTGAFPRDPEHLAGFGTPYYMAPEQWTADAVDGRADIWAVCVMFYELLSGRLPRGELTSSPWSVTPHSEVPKLSKLMDVPPCADEVVQLGLMRDPRLRFQSPTQLRFVLHRVLRALHDQELRRMDDTARLIAAAVSVLPPRFGSHHLRILSAAPESEVEQSLRTLLQRGAIYQLEPNRRLFAATRDTLAQACFDALPEPMRKGLLHGAERCAHEVAVAHPSALSSGAPSALRTQRRCSTA